jgi:hypothetical protein
VNFQARTLLPTLAALLIAGHAAAQPNARYAPPANRTHIGSSARPLTGPSTAAPGAVVVQFLRERGIEVSEATLVRTGDPAPAADALTVIRFEQRAGSLRVYGVSAKASLTARGELVHLVENFATSLPASVAASGVSETQALDTALRRLYPGQSMNVGPGRREGNSVVFERTPFFHAAPRVTRVAYRSEDGAIRGGLLVETWSQQGNQLDHTLVGPAGDVLFVEQRTNSDTYNVFGISPRVSAQEMQVNPAGAESPQGWLFPGSHRSIDIAGNNVRGYLDAKSNNRADDGGVTITDGNFITAADLTQAPSTAGNREVAVQNLFFYNNRVHDILYAHGFNEAAGNFQEDNFSNGGQAGDSVNAEAQDGRGLNNANFATPTDGSNPRMQMYLWSGVGDSQVVVSSGPVAGIYLAILADFGSSLRNPVSGEIVLVNDGNATGTGASATDGCTAPVNAVAGKIALVDRGFCDFVVKAANVQAAGAIGLIVANNRGGTDVVGMGGTDRTIKIPALMISQNDGATLRSTTGVQATLQLSPEAPLQIDSSLDTDVIYHEYGHGLTWRMIGGMSGPIAGALGEGSSDVVAMLINGDDRIGEYSATATGGIRRAPYGAYPNTYSDVLGDSVHADGEIFAAIMWRLRELLGGAAASATLLGDFVAAMNVIPATPSYEDMRTGLLATVGNDCAVWTAFANFGVGEGSSAVVTRSGVTITESFVVPAGVCTAP